MKAVELGVEGPPPEPGLVASSLAALIDDPDRRRALASAAQHSYRQRFTAEPWVRRTRALYDEVHDYVSKLAARDDNEIAVAVFVEIADCERALEIGADEAVGERGLKRADETRQHRVQVWIGRRRSH